MRVLLTTDTVGGVWTFTRELAAGLLRCGHAVALVSFGRMPAPEQAAWCAGMRVEFGEAFRFEASEAPLEWMKENEVASRGGEGLLLRVAEEFGVEVVHASQFCFGALPFHGPKVVTAHSDVLSWAEACRPEGLEDSEWLRRYRGLVQGGLDGAAAVVAPTQWMAEALRRGFDVGSGVKVIYNGRGVGARDVSGRGGNGRGGNGRSWARQAGEVRALQAVSAGRLWDEAKGLTLLEDLDAGMPVVVAGERAYGGALLGEAPRGVRWLGALGGAEVLELFWGSSVYVVTSVYEPFGLAPLEAALCGCAVVARGLESLREIWGEAALYFEDAAGLAAALRRLREEPETLAVMQERAGARARAFTVERMVRGYVEVYAELMEARVGRDLRETAYA